MCEYTEELYSRWLSRKLTRIEQAFFEEHMQNCADCSTLVLEENKERLTALRVSSLKFGFGIGLLASLITSIGLVIGLNNLANYSSRDFIISGILYLPIALFTGVQIVAFKLSEAANSKLSNLLRSIVTLFVFSTLLYSVLFNIPALAKASHASIGRFNESLILFLNIVLSAFYWVIGNRLAIQAYNRELETSSFVASLLSTWVLVLAGISYLAIR
ncbi:MAG TPA: zf-HC2 domain-containing protein [Thermodesulfobacteriota bacterium]|nr:zf-HC2 domain-containing protein [Thermodesulfobacteriota bacterium]